MIQLHLCGLPSITAVALLLTAGLCAPASAQFRTQDQCKDVLVNAVFDTKAFYANEYYQMFYASDEKRDLTRKDQRDRSVSGNLFGISGGLSSSDKSYLRDTLAKRVDLRILYDNRAYLLLQSGQKEIVNAWTECMKNRGGGPTVYFTEVEGNPKLADLHLQNRSGAGFRGPDLRIATNVPIDSELGVVKNRDECVKEGYILKWGSECTVRIETISAWRTDTINVPLTDGENIIEFPAYLAPRVRTVHEVKSWPTEPQRHEWKAQWGAKPPKERENLSDVNAILWSYGGKNNEDRGLMETRPKNCASAEEGWFFLEGEKKPHPRHPKISISDYVQVEVQGPVDLCTVNWHLTTDRMQICIWGSLGTGNNPHPFSCNVSVRATMARVVWQEKAHMR